MSFAARWPGICPECDGRFDVDDQIVRVNLGATDGLGQGGYRHTVCPELVAEKPTKFVGTSDAEMGF